ncbi:MAG: type II CAAX endopeptidase family protein, partial [Flavitalea sp.]
MALPGNKSPLIPYGWIRAILLLIVYVGLTVAAAVAMELFLPSGANPKNASEGAFHNISTQIWLTASFIFAVACVWFFTIFIDRRKINYLPFSFSSFHPSGTIGFLLGIFLIGAGALILYFARSAEWSDINVSLEDLLISIVLLFMVAVAEELVFRGYILNNLMDSMNQWLALIVSAILFAVIHADNPGVQPIALLNVLLAGLLTGISYLYTRSLWFPILWHFSWNLFQGPIVGFRVSGLPMNSIFIMETSGNPLLTGGDFGFEASL